MFFLNKKFKEFIYKFKKNTNDIYIIFTNEELFIEELKKKIKKISIKNKWIYKIFYEIKLFYKTLINFKKNNFLFLKEKFFLIRINKIKNKNFFLFKILKELKKKIKLILIFFNTNFFSKSKIIEIIRNNFFYLEIFNFKKNQILYFIKYKLKKKKINFKNKIEKYNFINLLINKYEDKLILLNQELKKIYILYKKKKIKIKYIKKLLSKKEEFLIFNITKYILKNDLKNLFRLINFYKNRNTSSNGLLTILINFLKNFLEYKKLINNKNKIEYRFYFFKKYINKKEVFYLKNKEIKLYIYKLLLLYSFNKTNFDYNIINKEIKWNKLLLICLNLVNYFN